MPNKLLYFTLLFSFMFFSSSGELWAEAPGGVSREGSSLEKPASGLILVRFKPDVPEDTIESVLQRIGVVVLKSFRYTGISVLKVVDKSKSIKQATSELNESGIVEYAEPDHSVRINDRTNDP
ncbi:MAG: hypothetical protein V1689_16060 [Pseudomonadota bacterium]